LIAIRFSSSVALITEAVPPRCMLALNSPGIASRCIVATTFPSITNKRKSLPFASLMNS
jgi:hypothetical protein